MQVLQQEATSDLLTASGLILDLLSSHNKFLLMPALKHYKFLLSCTTPTYQRFQMGYNELIIQLSRRKNHGILDGQMREIGRSLRDKENTVIAISMAQAIQRSSGDLSKDE